HSISFFVMTPPPHRSTLFPYTTLFRSKSAVTKPNTNSIQVPDTANTLFKSFKKYYWNVTAYVDIRGKKVRIQSDPAYFEMGMLDVQDWTAKWIHDAKDKDFGPAPLFRKTFEA